jgi:hypothetical protein
MQVALKRICNAFLLFPDPEGLVQEIVDKGLRRPSPVLKELAFLHFTRTALVAEKDPEQKLFKRSVKKVGIDPHTSYANMLCDVAWSKANGSAVMIMPEEGAEAAAKPPGANSATAEKMAEALPGLDASVLSMVVDMPEGTCGRCAFYPDPGQPTGACPAMGLNVSRTDPACPVYEKRAAR